MKSYEFVVSVNYEDIITVEADDYETAEGIAEGIFFDNIPSESLEISGHEIEE